MVGVVVNISALSQRSSELRCPATARSFGHLIDKLGVLRIEGAKASPARSADQPGAVAPRTAAPPASAEGRTLASASEAIAA